MCYAAWLTNDISSTYWGAIHIIALAVKVVVALAMEALTVRIWLIEYVGPPCSDAL